MTDSIRWIESTSWELDFFGLPHRIPWPGDVDAEVANRDPFEIEHLLRAIETLGTEADSFWRNFAAAASKFEGLAEAIEENEIPRAAALLNEVEQIHPGTSFSLFHQAYVARHEGRNEDAIALYQQAVEKTPGIAPIWINLGAAYAALGKRDEAVKAFRQTLQISPNNPMALEGLASLRDVVKLKANDPRHPNAFAYMEVSAFHQMAGQQVNQMTNPDQLLEYAEQILKDGIAPAVALQALERANLLRPGSPKTLFMLAGACHGTGQLERARDLMAQYSASVPNDPNGPFRLAQILHAMQDLDGERAALDRALQTDPNFQAALAVRFQLSGGEHDPAKEDALADFGEQKKSWMAYVLASGIARQRGDTRTALRLAERALAINPEGEETLLHYAVTLGDAKELGKLASTLRPAVESGRYSKRLDWNYAQVLNDLGLTKDAVAVLRRASANAPEDFQRMASTMIDAWTGVVSGCGVRLEVSSGFLMRPILITLEDGDGGVVIDLGASLPATGRFPWRVQGPETMVCLQQGHSGSREPRSLGVFRMRGVTQSEGAPGTIDCEVIALPDGNIHFRASQGGRKLPVAWAPAGA